MVEPANGLVTEDTNADAHETIPDIAVNIEVEDNILLLPSIHLCCGSVTLL